MIDPNELEKISDRSELDPYRLTLNQGETFAIFDRIGDIRNYGERSQGVFYKGCRFLSCLELRMSGRRPELLSSTVREECEVLSADLTNPEVSGSPSRMDRGTIHLGRMKFLRNGSCHEKIRIENFGLDSLVLPLEIRMHADFKDLFELRGLQRQAERGSLRQGPIGRGRFEAVYDGKDGIRRQLQVTLPEDWEQRGAGSFHNNCELAPGKFREMEIVYEMSVGAERRMRRAWPVSLLQLEEEVTDQKKEIADLTSSNNLFNHWVGRSKLDLISLLSEVGGQRYPFAGVPWYNTVFGRDGIITAMQCLLVAPQVARDVLTYLGNHQAGSDDSTRDAEPGKILHEVRDGELVNLGEVPFKHYYGSVDSTPLYLWLAGLYLRRTGDVEFIRKLWPNIKLALEWIDRFGDIDGDGFVEYERRSEKGLTNQGWKDSFDSISHADGSLLEGPIALCEVQAYTYQAKLSVANIAECLGEPERADSLRQQAADLKKAFNEAFWIEKDGFVALALDGKKHQASVVSSNPGHCLAASILDGERAERVAERLMVSDLYSGWGLRTLSAKEKRYNPMSYHNGSIWPHDTSIAAWGMAIAGKTGLAARICEDLFEASSNFPMQRVPELFCGFDRRPNEGPVQYPVACSPQAWAVASVYQLISSQLGIEVHAEKKLIHLTKPALPSFLSELRIENIMVPGGHFGLRFIRFGGDVSVDVLEKPEDWSLLVKK